MKKTILITGASSGIGKSCAQIAVKHDLSVIATARNSESLEQLLIMHQSIKIIVADISTETGREKIFDSIHKPIDFILHNAALLQTPQKLVDLRLKDFRLNLATNAEPIIFLTQMLLKKLNLNARILSVSSGAAQQAIAGLGHYCISKAAALMATEILKVELQKSNILVNNFFPGVVDTRMQKTLRKAPREVFPFVDTFQNYKKDDKLSAANEIAIKILNLFLKTDCNEFLSL